MTVWPPGLCAATKWSSLPSVFWGQVDVPVVVSGLCNNHWTLSSIYAGTGPKFAVCMHHLVTRAWAGLPGAPAWSNSAAKYRWVSSHCRSKSHQEGILTWLYILHSLNTVTFAQPRIHLNVSKILLCFSVFPLYISWPHVFDCYHLH